LCQEPLRLHNRVVDDGIEHLQPEQQRQPGGAHRHLQSLRVRAPAGRPFIRGLLSLGIDELAAALRTTSMSSKGLGSRRECGVRELIRTRLNDLVDTA
jgi:hypothetical protein